MTPGTQLARKLASGIYGRLEFDFACNRGHAFSEAYLYGVVMEVLASNIDPNKEVIEPSWAVPAIQRTSGGSGRKREVDFAVLDRGTKTELKLCV